MSGKREREKRREERLTAETSGEEQNRRRRLMQLGGATALAAVLVVIALIVVSQSQDGSGGDVSLEHETLVERQLRGIPQNGTTIGQPDAKVTLVEFGDLQCPVCKSLAEDAIPKVISGPVRGGEAKIEFRNFVVISEQSVDAGAAALAAGEQGRGWNFIELFYRNQGEEASGYVTDSFLTSVAEGAGVRNIDKWNRDRGSKRIVDEVTESTEEARLLGLTGTPSFTIKGPGGQESLGTLGSAEEIESAIREAQ